MPEEDACACTFGLQLIVAPCSHPGTDAYIKDSFLAFFAACVDFHSLKPSLWLLD